ncbi:flagellar hook-length control protein FliK [Evansella sp. LMS18]|uniref:flagellar hook-length control protein FliK n=1 Tax=Evansella sp. LMS18 TaxID=2924033 RepID=UPI0020D1631E|nr:flagellar hook-length control protein FliK [Evansella sp. LMS18]UTR10864.1 flagellar hook-length control protein FliK [Evansella sp. LMS18]
MINGIMPGLVPGRQHTGFVTSVPADLAGKNKESKTFLSFLEDKVGKGADESGAGFISRSSAEREEQDLQELFSFLKDVVLADADTLFNELTDGEFFAESMPEKMAADILNKLQEAVEEEEMGIPGKKLEDPEFIIALLSIMPQPGAEYGQQKKQAYERALPLFSESLHKLFPWLSPLTAKNVSALEELGRQVVQILNELPEDKLKAAGLRDWTGLISGKTKPVDSSGNFILPQAGKEATAPIQIDPASSHLSRLQQFFLHTGSQPSERVTEEQFLRQFQSVLKGGVFRNMDNGIQQLTVKLHPQHLGRLDITIQQVNGVLIAKLTAATSQARELIEGQLHQLRQAFLGQQIQVDRVEVTQQQVLKDSQGQAGEESGDQQPSPEKDRGEEEDEETFAAFLEETINMKV